MSGKGSAKKASAAAAASSSADADDDETGSVANAGSQPASRKSSSAAPALPPGLPAQPQAPVLPVDPEQDMSEEDKYADNPFIEILRELPQSKAEVDFKSFTAMFPTKLSGQGNWRQWLFALENVTSMHDLGPILNPGMDSLVESAVNFENADDQQATREYAVSLTRWADRFFRQVLSVIVVETHLEIVISAPTGGAAFRQLHALFGKVSPITIAELERSFFTASRLADDGDVGKHVATLTGLHAKINSLHKKDMINNYALVQALLNTLPASWSAWIDATSGANDSATLRADDLSQRILSHAASRASRASAAPAGAVPLPSISAVGRYDESKKKPKQKHPKSSKDTDMICFRCEKRGHTAAYCKAPAPLHASAEAKRTAASNGPTPPVSQARGGKDGGSVRSICSITSVSDKRLYLDSASSEHLVDDSGLLHDYRKFDSPVVLQMADPSATIKALGVGTLHLQCDAGLVMVKEVLFAPSVGKRLLSIGRCHRELSSGGMDWHFLFAQDGHCRITTAHGLPIATAVLDGTLYPTSFILEPSKSSVSAVGAAVAAEEKFEAVDEVDKAEQSSRIDRSLADWHNILGHASTRSILAMANSGAIKITGSRKAIICDACHKGKATLLPYKARAPDARAKTKGERIHVDCVVLSGLNGISGFCIATDEATGYKHELVYKSNVEVRKFLLDLASWYSVQARAPIRVFKLDNGSEFSNLEFRSSCAERGIVIEFTPPYSSQSAGLAERNNRTVIDDARTILIAAKLHKDLWPHAVRYVVQIRNRIGLRRLKWKSPMEIVTGKKPDYDNLRAFGATGYTPIAGSNQSKMDPRSYKCVVVGFDATNIFTVLYMEGPKSGYTSRSRHVRFVTFDRTQPDANNAVLDLPAVVHEAPWTSVGAAKTVEPADCAVVPMLPVSAASPVLPVSAAPLVVPVSPPDNNPYAPLMDPLAGADHKEEEEEEEVIVSDDTETDDEDYERAVVEAVVDNGRPKRDRPSAKGLAARFGNAVMALVKQDAKEHRVKIGAQSEEKKGSESHRPHEPSKDRVPSVYLQPDLEHLKPEVAYRTEHWRRAMRAEIAALEDNETWELVPRPKKAQVLTCRWVFATKTDTEGNVVRYKARIVARGFAQAGSSYDDTFAPVADATNFRTVLALTSAMRMKVRSYDVANAFTTADLDRVIYMEAPYALEVPAGFVLKLKKSLYGLRQAANLFHMKVRELLISNGFKPTHADPCVYIKWVSHMRVIVCSHVDDFFTASENEKLLDELEKLLMSAFSIKRGDGTSYLAHNLTFSATGAAIDARQKIYALARDYDLSVKLKVPWTNIPSARAPDEPVMNLTKYRALLGRLGYLATACRPDIAVAVNWYGRFQCDACERHYEGLLQIARYLSSTPTMGLVYPSSGEISVTAYADADWSGDASTGRSTTGFLIYVAGALVYWRSRRQGSVALSTHAAELIAASECVEKMVELRALLEDLGCDQSSPSSLYLDNLGAVTSSNDDLLKTRALKQSSRILSYVKEQVAFGSVVISHVPSEGNTSDVLTKPLSFPLFSKHRAAMGMRVVDT